MIKNATREKKRLSAREELFHILNEKPMSMRISGKLTDRREANGMEARRQGDLKLEG